MDAAPQTKLFRKLENWQIQFPWLEMLRNVIYERWGLINIPILQLSIDYTKALQYHYVLSKELYALRKKGVLIIGIGDMVHNLRMVAWDRLNDSEYAYDWALLINNKFKHLIVDGDYIPLINYTTLGKEAMLAIPTPEHYLLLMYTLDLK